MLEIAYIQNLEAKTFVFKQSAIKMGTGKTNSETRWEKCTLKRLKNGDELKAGLAEA